jgi:hypothetical protein
MSKDIPGCEDGSLEERLLMIKTAIVGERIGKDILVRTEEKDGWYAGVVRCVALPDIPCPRGRESCALLKSAFIFDDEKEARTWIEDTMRQIKKSITPFEIYLLLKEIMTEQKGRKS